MNMGVNVSILRVPLGVTVPRDSLGPDVKITSTNVTLPRVSMRVPVLMRGGTSGVYVCQDSLGTDVSKR